MIVLPTNIVIPVLTQKNTILRTLKNSDASSLFLLINENRNFLRKWLFWVDLTKEENDSLEFIVNSNKQQKEGKQLVFGIFYNDCICGTVGFVSIDQKNCSAELGYWLSPVLEGKGLITSSCLALIDYSFMELGFYKIFSRALTDNHKSLSVFGRLGMHIEDGGKEFQYFMGETAEFLMTKGTITNKYI